MVRESRFTVGHFETVDCTTTDVRIFESLGVIHHCAFSDTGCTTRLLNGGAGSFGADLRDLRRALREIIRRSRGPVGHLSFIGKSIGNIHNCEINGFILIDNTAIGGDLRTVLVESPGSRCSDAGLFEPFSASRLSDRWLLHIQDSGLSLPIRFDCAMTCSQYNLITACIPTSKTSRACSDRIWVRRERHQIPSSANEILGSLWDTCRVPGVDDDVNVLVFRREGRDFLGLLRHAEHQGVALNTKPTNL